MKVAVGIHVMVIAVVIALVVVEVIVVQGVQENALEGVQEVRHCILIINHLRVFNEY